MKPKRILAFLLSMVMVLSMLPTNIVFAEAETELSQIFDGGDGKTEDSAFKISTAEQLAAFRDSVNEGETYENMFVKLMEDIDLDGSETNRWTPIGASNNGFAGTFNGYGHEISGLYINATSDTTGGMYGLFGLVSSKGTIKSLGVDGSITLAEGNAGGIAGKSSGTIENCYNKADIYKNGDELVYAGGIVGWLNERGKIKSSYNAGYIEMTGRDKSYAGGLAGYTESKGTYKSTIENSYNVGTITTQKAIGMGYAGGLLACGYDVNITNCYNAGTIIGQTGYSVGTIGSMIGQSWDAMNNIVSTGAYYLENCTQNGTEKFVIGTALTDEQMKSAESFVGWDFDEVWEMKGELGKNRPTLKNNPDKSDVYVIKTSDELVELFDKLGAYNDAYAGKTIKLGTDIDLTGIDWKAKSIEDATFDGDGHTITGLTVTSSTGIGGLFNIARNTVIKNLGVVGAVDAYTGGGIVAVAKGNLLIENCYSAVDVTGGLTAGGILGYAQGRDNETFNVEIRNCYNIGKVSGNRDGAQVGGIVGKVTYSGSESSSLTVTNCYNAGSVSSISAENVYPIVCEGTYSATADCYYLNTCGSTKAGGAALTAEQMKDATSFENWDFSKVWNVKDIFAGRPTLKKTPEKAETGTESNPYTIGTYEELAAFNESINDYNNPYDYDGKYIKLTADINVPEGESWSSYLGTFRGTFDGDRHKIKTLKSDNGSETGLFGLADGATIKNLELYVDFKCDCYHGACAVGGIVGNGGIGTVIENCVVFGSISAGSGRGNSNGGIGGIMGSVSGGVIRDSANYATVSANNKSDDGAGGILGKDHGYSTIERCVNHGSVTKPKEYDGNYQLCHYNAGGIIGGGTSTKIRNCCNNGDITGGYNLGGIAGYINESKGAETGEISNCYNKGKITAKTLTTNDVGAIYGDEIKITPVTNCYYLTVDGCELPDYGRGATGKTAEQFKSGEVAWLLQDGQPKDATTGVAPLVWTQAVTDETSHTIDLYPYPVSDEEFRVHKVTFVKKNTELNAEDMYVEHDAKYTNNGCKLTSMPSEPTSEIYTFKNWVYYDDPENIFNENTAVNADVDVLALGNEISTNPDNPPSDVIEIKKNTNLLNTPQQIVLPQYVANKSGAAVNMDNVEFKVNSESALPPGMQLSTPPVLVTGKPNKVGTYTVVFDVINKGVAPMSLNPEGTQLTLTFNIGLEGEGTETSPYLINDVTELVYFRDNVNSGGEYGNSGVHVKLMDDIDLSTVCSSTLGAWTPIGKNEAYKGVFDGNEKEISNLYVETAHGGGLFRCNSGTIKKLIVSGEVKGLGTSGGIAAENSGTIEMCINKCSVSMSRTYDYVGGLAGKNYTEGIIKNCYNVGDVTGTEEGDKIGGIVGDNDGKIENCYNIGTVTGTQSDAYVGGIAGVDWVTTGIKNCYYLSTAASGGICGSDVEGSAESRNADEFASGEVAWLLQDAQPKDETGEAPLVWGQIVTSETGNIICSEPTVFTNEYGRVRKVTFVKKNTDPNVAEEYVEHDAKYTNDGCKLTSMPSEPTSEIYTFKNWVYYDDPEIIFDENTAVNADVDVVALGNEITTESENSPSDVINISKNKDMTPVDLTAYVANKSGASAKMFEFELADEELPEGVTLGLDKKTVSGKPTATVGTYTVAFNVTNKGVALMSLNPEGTQLKIKFEVGLEGEGTEEKPYLINDVTELVYFRDNVNSGGDYGKGVSHVKLMSDIDLITVCSSKLGSWEPIGDDYHPFYGTFDGNEKLISNLYINGTGSNQGLFGYNEGTIKKLSVSGTVTSNDYVGGIVGDNAGTIELCRNSCSVTGTGIAGETGGIAGRNSTNGIIKNCYNTGSVTGKGTGTTRVGGIAGYNYSEIANCYSEGVISAKYDNDCVGGVVGLGWKTNVKNCYYLSTAASGGFNKNDIDGKAEGKTEEQFESGEVAWLLQNGQPIDTATGVAPLVWGQKLVDTSISAVSNNDLIPIFTKDSAKKVYSVEFWSNNEAVGDYALYNNNVKYANVGDDVPLASHTSEIFRGWAESIGADTVLRSYTFRGNADVKLYAAWKGKVTFSNPASTSRSYTAGTPKTITPEVLVDGEAATALSASDFAVKYYELNENVGTHGELKSTTPVTNAISAGKYLCVIDFARNEPKDDYYIKSKFEVTNSTPAVLDDDILTAYDNVRFMYIKSGNEAAQKPIYFEKQVINAKMTDTVSNNLVNPNTSTVTYTSSDESVATVDNSGNVTIKGAGSTVIVATSTKENAADIYASYTLNVTKEVITVTAKDKSISYGDAFAADGYTVSKEGVTLNGTPTYTTDYRRGDGAGRYDISVSGLSSELYEIEYKTGKLTVTPKALSLGTDGDFDITVNNKEYDGTKDADITATVKSASLYSGDKVTVLISGSYDKATVDAEAVTYEITGLSGKDSANYTLSGTMTGTLDAEITPAKVKLSAPSYTSYVYDGEAKSVNVVAYANGIYFDKFTVKYATTTSEETAPGSVGTYTVKVTLTDNNYQLDPSVSFDATLEIKSAQQSFFSIEGVSDTVTYGDTVKLQAPGAIDGGDISYSVIAGTDYAEVDSDTGDVTLKGVGTVTVKATSTKANYAEKTATRTFVIKPKTLTVTAAAENKIYDGSTDVTVSLTLSGVADGDSDKVAIDNSELRAVMESADVENGKTVYITDIGLTGEKAANYQLSSSSMQTTVNVSKKKITEVEMTANDKEYDGTTAAAGYTVKKLSGVIDADKDFVKVAGTASFDDKTVSGASKVTLSELVLSGAKSGNYYLGVDKAEASAKINKATVNFEFGALSYVYDGTAKTVSVTAKAGGKAFEGFSVKYGGEASRKNVGEYAIEITLNDEANYVSDYAGDKKLKIVEAEQSEMTLTGLPGTIEFGRQFTLTAIGGSSEISTTWESSNESIATVSGKGLVTITGIGEVTITAKKRADGNLKEQSASITFTPTKRAVTIKVTNLNQVYDGQVKEVGVTTIAESTTVKYFDEDNNPVAEPKNAGTYYVEVTANGNYEGEQSAVLTIKKAKLNTQGIAINVPSDLVYGTAYNVTVSSYEGTDYTLTYVGTGLYGDEENAPKNAGSYTAILTIENANYETATVKKPFTIAKKTLTAKADDKERAYGENNPELTVTLTGFCSGDDESAILMMPTASTKATSSSAVAAYDITVSGGYADNYDFTYEKGTLTVNAANNGNFYISGGNTNPYVGNSFTLTAYYNNERPTVTWSSSDSGIAAVDQTGKVTIIDVGSVTITAKMNDSRFDSSLEATFKLTASRLPETQNAIFFTDPIVEKYIDAEAFTLAPTNLSDGASVTEYKSSNPEIASVDNNGKVTLHKVGTVVITAKAEKFNCADVYASYTLTVKKVPVTVTAVDKSLTYGDEFVGEVKFSDDELKAADFGGTLSYNTRYSVGKGVGEYDVTPSGLTSDKYDITFVTGTITVNEKTLKGTDFDVKVKESKPYDGTTDIKLSATVKESAVVGNDKLYVEIEGAYDDASAGEDIGVTYDILSISGRGFENYVLEDTTGLTTKANIEKAEVIFFVSNETVKNYDGTAQKVEISAMVNGNVFGSENYTVWYKKGDEEKTKTPVNVGEYKVSVELADEDNYKVKEFDAVLTISMDEEAELTIKGSNKNVTVGDMFTLYAQYGNENAEVSWSSNDESVATVDEDGNVTVKKSGEVTLTATMTDPNYNGLSAELDLTASKKHINLSVSASELVKVYNGEAQYIKFTSDTVDLEKENVKVNTAYVMTTDSDKQEPKDVGTYTVSYEIEDERYEGSNVLQLTINKATVTVYAEAIEKEYGDEPVYKLIVSDNVKGISSDSMIEDGFVTITSDGEAKTAEVGEYGINVALKYLSDNNVDYVVKDSGKLTVTKATLTLSVADITREYGEKNPTELTYEIKGFKNGETEAVLTGSISPAYSATIEEKVGVYKDAVTVAGALENKNYNVVVKYTDGEGADLTITRVKVKATAGTAKTSYLSAKFDKGLTGLTADNFTVKNGNETVILTGVTSSGGGKTYTLKGKFTEGVTYTVTISLDGSAYEETHEIVEGSTLEITPARATSTGGGGGGGSSSGGSATVSYTVTFETNGGSKISSVKVEKNSNVTAPAEPTKEGFEFGGWYTDKKLTKAYDFDTEVTKSLTLYAKWNEAEEPEEDKKDDSEKNENKENKEWKNPFNDVKENDWYYDSVKYANENGLMSGVTNTEFAPEGTLTRGMLVTVLYRAEGSPAVNKSIAFGDVDASAYYLAAVNWAQQNGIVSGISETEFAPDENITREQIATIIYRYAKFKGIAPEGAWAIKLDYADLDEISDYAAEGIMYCTMKGIMQGKDNNMFAPKDNATRAEIAAILQRFANEVK